ncbi:MAG: hypothetical protein ACREBG_13960 [Pyrinomonadaceae bacterium]
MKTKMRTITILLSLVFGIGAILLSGVTKANIPVIADDDDTVVRWDIVHLAPPFCPTPGGNASATTHHNNNSTITLTGSGTFEPGDRKEVTGGGTWTTASGSGTYRVTELVSWIQAPGAVNCSNDTIPGQRSAGLAVLRIRYNDGSKGVLTVSCRLPGTPTEVFEGIAVTKGFVGYTHNVEPIPGVDANRTLFHIQQEQEDDNKDN